MKDNFPLPTGGEGKGATEAGTGAAGRRGSPKARQSGGEGENSRVVDVLAMLVLLAVALQVGRTFRFAETDLWWNLATGREIISQHRLPRQDSFAFTPTLPVWHNHEWLTAIVFYEAMRNFGADGIVTLKTLITVGVFFFCAAAALEAGAGTLAVSFFIVLTSIGFYPATSIRPQLFSYLFFSWFLLVWQGFSVRSPWFWFLTLPCVPLWVGFHGGFVVGLATLGVLGLGKAVDLGWKEGKFYLLFIISFLVLTLINPYGVGLWKFLVEAVGHDRSLFFEWGPVTLQWQTQWPYFLSAGLTVFSLAVSRPPKSKGEMGILLFTAVIGFLRSRLAAFFVVASWVFVPHHFESVLMILSTRVRPSVRRSAIVFSFAAVLYGLACVCYSIDRDAFRWDWRLKLAARSNLWRVGFPVDVVQYMEHENLSGNVACPLTWGGFLTWTMYPHVKVSLDGRWDTIYSQDVIREGIDFEYGRNWESYLKKYKPDMVLAYKGSVLDQGLSASPAWTRRFEGVEGVLFLRR